MAGVGDVAERLAPSRAGAAARPPRIAIIGAGYAGLAAAVELAARDIPVTVFEASRTLGGRARRVERNGIALDNGQHILVGAYRETLRLMRRVGLDPDRALLRLPLTLVYPGHLRLRAPRLPAPLHLAWALAAARGAGGGEKLAAMQFMNCLKAVGYELARDLSVAELLDDHGQSGMLRQRVWEPLCVAALNTPAERASARVFIHVLRDTLGGRRAASDLLLPRVDLSRLFPEAAADFVMRRGGTMRTGMPITGIASTSAGFHLRGAPDDAFSHVVLAVGPHQIDKSSAGLAGLEALRRTVAAFSYEPIVTCYLAYDPVPTLTEPMIGMTGDLTQWLLDRGRLGGPPGLLAAVISASGPHQSLAHDELAVRINAEVAALVRRPLQPRWTQVIEEKRATFACTPDLLRPDSVTPVPNLLVAGDYVASDYPATLESAVRSGVRCAELIAAGT